MLLKQSVTLHTRARAHTHTYFLFGASNVETNPEVISRHISIELKNQFQSYTLKYQRLCRYTKMIT